MPNLYLIQIEFEYQGTDLQDFLKIWLEDVAFYLKEHEAGRAKQLWKSVAERKVFIVMERNAEEVDKMLFETPLMRKLGNQAKVQVTQLIPYENFANNTNEIISAEARYQVTEPLKPTGMYFWAEFNVNYTGHTLDELLRIWSEEAAAALGAKKAGVVVDLWKSVGMRQVHALLNFDTLEALDGMSFALPVMKQNGNNVDLKVKALRSFESFHKHLKTIVES